MAMRMYKMWGQGALNIIRNNPYLLCDTIDGITFSKADQFAASLGVAKDDPERIKSGIKYALSYNATNNGHTMVPRETVIKLVAALLQIEEEKIYEPFEALEKEKAVITEKYSNNDITYLAEYYNAEQFIARKLYVLDKMCPKEHVEDIDRLVAQIENEEGIEYAPMQRKAIISAVNSGVMILTGGPGTGKTTIIRAVIRIMDRMGLSVVLAAPTGRAAKRMSEATGYESKTIHRLLETSRMADSGKSVFNRDENNLLEADAVIIDETSMVDTLLC
jgi:exodeoxyribonuclease V alpha subunit